MEIVWMEINLVVGKLILIHPLAANGTDAGLYNQSMCLKYVCAAEVCKRQAFTNVCIIFCIIMTSNARSKTKNKTFVHQRPRF